MLYCTNRENSSLMLWYHLLDLVMLAIFVVRTLVLSSSKEEFIHSNESTKLLFHSNKNHGQSEHWRQPSPSPHAATKRREASKGYPE